VFHVMTTAQPLPAASERAGAPQLTPPSLRTALRRRWVGAYSWDVLLDVHASNRRLATFAVDLVVVMGMCTVTGVTPRWSTAALWALVVTLTGYVGGTYGDRDTIQTRGMLWYPGKAVMTAVLVAFTGLASGLLASRTTVLLATVTVFALCSLRLLTWLTISTLRATGRGMRRTVVIGNGPKAEMVVRKLRAFIEGGLIPVANIPLEVLQTRHALRDILHDHEAQHLVLVPLHSDDIDFVAQLQRNRGVDAHVTLVPPLGDLFLHPGRVTELGGIPFVPMGRLLRTRAGFPGKRAFDVVVSGVLLLLLAPVFAVTAVAIRVNDGGPILFRQRRVGKGGEPFAMFKFRSMVVGADRQQVALRDFNFSDGLLFRMADDPRITRVGRLIRRMSIDELPQLLNVLRGEMSLVGPRPLPVDPEAFSVGDSERHTVLPGITGYWQISGGNGLAYQEMITLDLAYIRNWSLWLDIRLLLRTIPALVQRHDPA
jgi:exopolysaccharide biosynthesis polyprenyl glycosylphosphotransferase